MILFTGSAITSAFLVYLVRQNAASLGLVGSPNLRSAHVSRVPHGGGLGIAFASLVFGSAVLWDSAWPHLTVFLAGGVLMVAVSLWDDIKDVAPVKRLIVHLLASGLLIWLTELPEQPAGWASALLIVAGTLISAWWINLFNFLDGIDSIAGIEALTILAGIFVLAVGGAQEGRPSDVSAYLQLVGILAASIFAFLLFNWPPASIFLGDVGSTFLAFATAYLAMLGMTLELASVWSYAVLGGVFFVDATYTLIRRILKREGWWQPHNSHAYQCLSRCLASKANRTFAHKVVALGTGVINLVWLLPFALLAQAFPEYGLIILVSAWTPLVILVVCWSRPNYLVKQ